jgi:hypothetical protein
LVQEGAVLESLGSVAQATVAIIFAGSAVAKLREPSAALDALSTLRIPVRLRSQVIRALVLLELILAALLLTRAGPSAIVPAVLCLSLFTAFLVYLARSAPGTSCGCLGDVGSGEYAPGIVRNALLIALLMFAWLQGADHSWLTIAVGMQVAVLILVVTEGSAILRGFHRLTSEQSESTGMRR